MKWGVVCQVRGAGAGVPVWRGAGECGGGSGEEDRLQRHLLSGQLPCECVGV